MSYFFGKNIGITLQTHHYINITLRKKLNLGVEVRQFFF